ncbi:DUF4434 domain-containing protein [Thalassospira mesophila]|uniref:DUF4434 domain-containing protein n=1 Tax=Thalassospira mesophila TaxID=1293891 RepID=A0A1Y2KX18_9PROT|nr:DUF4434 domain-containing protein [Thalassospira mesophila]OSQ36408.1 hypothetical protein TMES_18105 [Thalassospira mesophila]
MRFFITILAILLASIPATARAQAPMPETMFYQPVETDAGIPPAQWQHIWQDSAKNGIKTVIVQWTSHGDNDFGGADGWLARTLRLARNNDLALVIGLHMDPDYYTRLSELDTAGTEPYLEHQLGLSLHQAALIKNEWQLDATGWYLPLELDDWNFQQKARRDMIDQQLHDLAGHLDAPLHVSSFTGGKLGPDAYAKWLEALSQDGIHVWAQNGTGTQTLPKIARRAYLEALPCDIGIVQEAFQQTSKPDQKFSAIPAVPDPSFSQCHPVSVFELRYLPWGAVLRQQ